MSAPVVEVVEPGVYEDMPDELYHRDLVPGGSLSHSGARLLLPPSCPAKFDYWRRHGRPPKPEFDLGHAAHRVILGKGADLVPIEVRYDDKHKTKAGQLVTDYATDAARKARDAAYDAGKTPVLARQMEQVKAMAAVVRADPLASRLLDPETVRIEASVFWYDDEFGVWRRARFDAWGEYIVDYKSASSAEPGAAARSMHNYGYHGQADWYLAAAAAVGRPAKAFLNVWQEVEPPYLLTISQPDEGALRVGRERNRRALEVYRDCVASGRWPGYADGEVVQLSLPRYAIYQHEESFA